MGITIDFNGHLDHHGVSILYNCIANIVDIFTDIFAKQVLLNWQILFLLDF